MQCGPCCKIPLLGKRKSRIGREPSPLGGCPVSSQQLPAAPELVIKQGRDRKLEQYPRTILATQSIHSQCLKFGVCSTVPQNDCQVREQTQCCWIYPFIRKAGNQFLVSVQGRKKWGKAVSAVQQESQHLPCKLLRDFCLNLIGWNRSWGRPSYTGTWESIAYSAIVVEAVREKEVRNGCWNS